MASSKPILAGQGALWLQERPNTQPYYLGCHELGPIAEPKGDITLLFCKDPSQPNKFEVVSSFQGAPGPVTTSLMTDVQAMKDFLEQFDDPVQLYVTQVETGKMNVLLNYSRAWILAQSTYTSKGAENLAVRDPDNQDRAVQTYEISAENLYRFFQPKVGRQAITEDNDILDIFFYDRRVGNRVVKNKYGVAGCAAGAAATANVLFTTDGGATWTAGSVDPFAADEDVASVLVIELDRNTNRIIAARGTTDGANPAEIGYSDDDGATWTLVDVGSINGQFAQGPGALFALDRYNIWLVTNGGAVYFSNDAGASWSVQQSAAVGQATTQDLNAVFFVDEDTGFAVGDSNAIIKTIDGGDTWTLVSGPGDQSGVNALSVQCFDEYNAWVGYGDADLYYTEDAGSTWSKRSHPSDDYGTVPSMSWLNRHIGAILYNPSVVHGAYDGEVLYTFDGGYDWERVSVPTNLGLNSIQLLTPTLAFIAGAVQDSTGFIGKVTGG